MSCLASRGMRERNIMVLQRCVCVCVWIIYIQVAYLTASVAQSHSHYLSTTHSSDTHTHLVFVLVFVYDHDSGWLLHKGRFQQLYFGMLTSSLFPFCSPPFNSLSLYYLLTISWTLCMFLFLTFCPFCGHNIPVVGWTPEGQCVFALCGLVIPLQVRQTLIHCSFTLHMCSACDGSYCE